MKFVEAGRTNWRRHTVAMCPANEVIENRQALMAVRVMLTSRKVPLCGDWGHLGSDKVGQHVDSALMTQRLEDRRQSVRSGSGLGDWSSDVEWSGYECHGILQITQLKE